jgi:hypothetical protein
MNFAAVRSSESGTAREKGTYGASKEQIKKGSRSVSKREETEQFEHLKFRRWNA